MRRIALLTALCAGVAAGADRKQVEALIQEVRDVSATEPALLSVDTQIRLAAVAAKFDPKRALETARDAGSLLLTLPDPETRGQFGIRLTEVLRQIDPEEARRFVLSMEPRTVSGVYRDSKAEALDYIVRYWMPRDRKRALEVLSEGVSAGAFRAESIKELMDVLSAEEPAAVPGLFAVMLAAFPEDRATDRDCLLLLRRAAQVAPVDSALAVEAARKILRALDGKRFQEDPDWRLAGQYRVNGNIVNAETGRAAIELEVEELLAKFSPETYNQHADRFRLNLAAAATITAASELKISPRDQGDREDSPLATLMLRGRPAPSLTELVQPTYKEPIEAALEQIRLDDSGASHALALAEIAMRRDATPAQRAQIADEAINEADKDPLLYSRLWVYEGLLPYLWQHGYRGLAIKAGQAMARTAARFCKCEDRACGGLKERSECLTANQRVAEDWFNFEITPDELGISDSSLRARSLVLKLKEMALPEAAR